MFNGEKQTSAMPPHVPCRAPPGASLLTGLHVHRAPGRVQHHQHHAPGRVDVTGVHAAVHHRYTNSDMLAYVR